MIISTIDPQRSIQARSGSQEQHVWGVLGRGLLQKCGSAGPKRPPFLEICCPLWLLAMNGLRQEKSRIEDTKGKDHSNQDFDHRQPHRGPLSSFPSKTHKVIRLPPSGPPSFAWATFPFPLILLRLHVFILPPKFLNSSVGLISELPSTALFLCLNLSPFVEPAGR